MCLWWLLILFMRCNRTLVMWRWRLCRLQFIGLFATRPTDDDRKACAIFKFVDLHSKHWLLNIRPHWPHQSMDRASQTKCIALVNMELTSKISFATNIMSPTNAVPIAIVHACSRLNLCTEKSHLVLDAHTEDVYIMGRIFLNWL